MAQPLTALVRIPIAQVEGGPNVLRLQQQLAMHTHAKAFDPIAEATALHALMWQHGMEREEIARAVGRSPGWVRDRIGLLQLTEGERRSVAAGRMSIAEAKLVVAGRRGQASSDPAVQRAAARASAAERAERGQMHCRTCTCGRS